MSTLAERLVVVLADATVDPTVTAVEAVTITDVVAIWLRDLAAEKHADSSSEWFGWLAEQVADGKL